MIALTYIGPLQAEALALLSPIVDQGHLVLLGAGARAALPLEAAPVALVALAAGAPAGQRWDYPWLGWNRSNDPLLALHAYRSGAAAVLPADITAPILLQAIEHALAGAATSHRDTLNKPQTYQRGAFIPLPPEHVLVVVDGVVASTVIHADGAEVLLGLYGPGQQLVGHPHDSCCIQLVAHTPAQVVVTRWQTARAQPNTAERLRFHLAQMEAWAAMQARPHLDQRIVGLLSLLAEQFGVPHPTGTVLTIKLTHAQLATAVGATRGTVTRTLRDLRVRGLLNLVDTPEGERLCLREREPSQHLPASGA